MDPTSACNLHCTGCWAAEYGNRLNLTFKEMDDIITQGKELGIYFYMFTGGEPLVRKDDILRLCEKHHDCAFLAYTNGTLVNEALCQEMVKLGNLYLAISLEGFSEVNDLRRGTGVFEKVMHAMDLLKEYGLIFGTSICYTSQNIETVTSDEFIDLILEKGCRYSLYFHYMPVGNDAAVELLPTMEQRKYMRERVREIRNMSHGKGIFTMDFRMMENMLADVLPVDVITSTSMQTVTQSLVYSFIIRMPTSGQAACLRSCTPRCLWHIIITSRSMRII